MADRARKAVNEGDGQISADGKNWIRHKTKMSTFSGGVLRLSRQSAGQQDKEAAAKQGNEQGTGLAPKTPDRPTVVPGGRELEVRVGTVTAPDPMISKANASLKNVKCFATRTSLVIAFDVDEDEWPNVGILFPLLVRLFDENGQHLTHFQTLEGFTPSEALVSRASGGYERLANAGVPPDQIPYAKPTQLQATGNELKYPVNVRDLRDATIVEVGFTRSNRRRSSDY